MMLIAALSPPVHWTTYVQTFAVIASTIGTFVYVYFTYHIMKWAVGQGKTGIELSKLTIDGMQRRKLKADYETQKYVIDLYVAVVTLHLVVKRMERARLPEWSRKMQSDIAQLVKGWEAIVAGEIEHKVRVAMSLPIKNLEVMAMSSGQWTDTDLLERPKAYREATAQNLGTAANLFHEVLEREFHVTVKDLVAPVFTPFPDLESDTVSSP